MIYNLVISVVLYNTKKEYIDNIIFCIEQSTLEKIRLVFVDNSQIKNDHLEEACSKNKKIEYIFTGKNSGYGAGHNIAISKYIDISKYHLVLNPDIIFDKDLLKNLFEKMEKQDNIGLSSVKIKFPNGQIQYVHRKNFSFINWLIRVINYTIKKIHPKNKIFDNFVKKSELRDLYDESEFEAGCVSGCFMFFRNLALRKIGLFNENFFMYCEDAEISNRISKKYKNKIFSDLSVFHVWQAESRKSLKMIFIHIKSLLRYFLKFY